MTNQPSVLAFELEKCRRSKKYLFERHYKLKDTSGVIRLMTPLRLAQRKLLAVVNYLRGLGKPVRIICGKARKRGSSSLIEADMLDEVMRHQYDGLVIAHDKPTAEYIFGITQRFYEHLDLPKPALYKGQTSKHELRFASHDGRIFVETANNVKAGTGRTPQYIHASEASKWEKGQDTIISLLQSIGDGPSTTVIFESTFYGEDALFLPMWEAAYSNSRLSFDDQLNVTFEVLDRGNWNGYVPIFISALDAIGEDEGEDKLLRSFGDEDEKTRFMQTLDTYEQMLVARNGVPAEFLNWRRFTIKHKTGGSVADFQQEYPITPEEAVKASGRARFDTELLDQMPIETPRIGFLVRESHWDRPIIFKRDTGEKLHLFKDPVRGHRYAIGVDVSEGLLDAYEKDPDASCAVVLDLDAGGEQCATLWGQDLSEEAIVAPLRLLAEWYNNAFIVVESNSTGKHTVIELAKIYPKDRIYHKMDESQGRVQASGTLGWRTHVGTRNILIGRLGSAITERAILLHDRRTVLECKRFEWGKNGRPEAKAGYHDDHVFAVGLAVIGMEAYPHKTATAEADAQRRTYDFVRRNRDKTVSSVTGY